MDKRALMLTAAVAALVSGHAYGATSPCDSTSTTGNCSITTTFDYPVYTGAPTSGVTSAAGNLGNITIGTDGVINITTNPPTAPAVTINSGTTAAPATVENLANIQYENVTYAVGVLLQEAGVPTSTSTYGTAQNWVGDYLGAAGTLNMLGSGTNKTGILIAGGAYPTAGTSDAGTGFYANTGLGVFTGYTASGSSTPVAINIGLGSVVEVQGTASYGINLIGPTYTQSGSTNVPTGGGSLIGNIEVGSGGGGSLELTPTTVGSTTPTENVAINIAGWMQPSATSTAVNPALSAVGVNCACAMVGDIDIGAGGLVSSEGQGAQGVLILGAVNGAFINSGQLETFGTTTPSAAVNAGDPEAGAALSIANNLSGGIYNDGPTTLPAPSNTATGSISMLGNAAAIEISPAINANEQLPITIGGYTDGAGFTYSLLNRGSISSGGEDANISNRAIYIAGQAAANVTLQDGIFNAGTITSTATTNANGPTLYTSLTATAIDIGNYVTVNPGTGGPSTTSTPYTLINSNAIGEGTISATIAGAQTGTATAILIEGSTTYGAPASLSSIFNSGVITASAQTTNLLSSTIAAYAIEDKSGTLTTIYNTGTISAASTQLDDNAQIAIAIDTSANTTKSVTITDQSTTSNSADIIGDIHYGTQPGTLDVNGTAAYSALVSGNIYFNNETTSDDIINIGTDATVVGEISEAKHGAVDISIANNGTLSLLTSLPTNLNATVSTQVQPNTPLKVNNLTVNTGGLLDISLSQGNNVNAFPSNNVTVISAQTVNIGGDGINPTMAITFGGFVGSPTSKTSEFVLVSTPSIADGGTFTIAPQELTLLTNTYDSALNPTVNSKFGIPFLFTSTICAYNVPGASGNEVCTGTEPYSPTNQEIVLTLAPKSPSLPVSQGGLGLTGNALKMFNYVNEALINDNTLGAAMVTDITNSQQAQQAYASFAPDVSGATRATAISLTDSATNIVAARQRDLRMYANQEGATTLWGQQFGQRLSQGNGNNLVGYNDSGYGFTFGVDDGDPADGRYGAAFTFFTGGMSQKEPVVAKTSSEYYLLSGYTDWRGKGFFLDTQLSAGYGLLKGRRYLKLTDSTTGATVDREAQGNRPTEMLAGSVTTGGIFTAGSTVFMPQLDLDGLTMREEAYNESNGGEGMNLHVDPYYANSLRLFAGANLRQDFNFGDFYFQPELRAGYRYDFIDGAVKLKANFLSVTPTNGQAFDPFSIRGPDPGHGNVVLGGGAAITTGAWSIGIDYDYVRAGSGPTQQTGILTLVGRI